MTLQPPQASIAGLIAAAAIALVCERGHLLTRSGAIAAAVIGAAVFAAGGLSSAAALIVFFCTSSLLGRWRRRVKERLPFEKGGRRDAGQVIANGGAAALAIVLAAAFPSHRLEFIAGFLGALSEASADTWATEIGSASGATPRLITTFQPVPAGRSGGISLPGGCAALAGSAVLGLFSFGLPIHGSGVAIFAKIALCGFIGSMCDSLLGATVQAQFAAVDRGASSDPLTERREPGSRLVHGFAWVNNDVVNFISTVVAAILAIAAVAIV